MSSDNRLDDALRMLAGQSGPAGVPAAADIRRRGATRRRRRRVASVALAAVAVVALGTGIALARPGETPHRTPVGPAGPVSESPASPTASPVVPPNDDPLLSGQRQVTVVRVAAAEGGLSLLDDGRLAEVDGDEGRQLFVFTPQGPDTYQIRTAEPGTCWDVRSSGSQPLRVEAAPCATGEPRQQFTVVPNGDSTYLISSHSAYLQNSRTRGLILEEAGDAPVTARFRLVDNGPAPT
ncbi:hypothetical protein GCM10011608_07180 [Micromonospora sonchi]|uniref:Ricin B lectin domain-containing protein n=1 Tax=Micromonospora sonchi TaxID=1763543 RepID=A0A917TIP5_9ACTN|nr:RICIN domain-containing protein [Micromonospora sonchi]GGM24910.1 hypothetical protein GCM10011608_07180 [Micromonospora sonchi]